MRCRPARLLAPCAAILLALAGISCGDPGGPEPPDFSGSYPGEFYVIASSGDPWDPVKADLLSYYPVTLRLAGPADGLYDFSSTNAARGLMGPVQMTPGVTGAEEPRLPT